MIAAALVGSFSYSPTLTRVAQLSVTLNRVQHLSRATFVVKMAEKPFDGPVVMGTEEMMSQKEFGTSAVPIQKDLRWGCDGETADRICNYNRHYAEYGGYWERATTFLKEESEASGEIKFYDSNTGKELFTGPKDRSWDEFVRESKAHGWPSFRDSEVNWDYVRVLPNGECISVDGTHLGHNLPDGSGNRYCINLVSVAGKPKE